VMLDHKWTVAHEIGDGFWRNLKRYRRYGYANAHMLDATTSQSAHGYIHHYKRRNHLRNWWWEYKHVRTETAGFSPSPLMRFASAMTASLVKLAYVDGCAIANRERGLR